ncbi:uncharacterized protein LOC125222704 isoform X2 [Salvia hispanica]|uniref:uncharacterized protein LOC125222704 isoform X2 n=1 Tax=Salvia hispanica TaxID=49212 RepID=UPI002009B2A0|nr:uncharacterized protein LOC125222704 isoform X2 [Salvia hispanica]
MYRQYYSRNQRNRGIKLKGSIGGLIRIRRKTIRPMYDEIESEEETTEEDEHEEEKLDAEVDQEETDITDGAREDGTVRESEGEIGDDSNGRKQEKSVEFGDHERGDKSSHEDGGASSSLTHDNHTGMAENEEGVVGISDQQHLEHILEQKNKENRGEEAYDGEIKKWLKVNGGEISADANPSSATQIVTNITTEENNLDSSEEGSSLTEAPTDNNSESSNSTTDVSANIPKSSEQNFTESVTELDQDQRIATENTSTKGSNLKTSIGLQQVNASTLGVENYLADSNSTGHTEPKSRSQTLTISPNSGRWNEHTKE